MDLGIAGRWALVCGASKGLGYGCARSLAGEGVNLVINARTEATLSATAARIAGETGVQVRAVAGDITQPSVQAAALAAAPQIDILINNAGGPPPGDSGTGPASTGWPHSMPTCSRPSISSRPRSTA